MKIGIIKNLAKLKKSNVITSNLDTSDNIYKDVFVKSGKDELRNIDIKEFKSSNKSNKRALKEKALKASVIGVMAGVSLVGSITSAYAGDLNSSAINKAAVQQTNEEVNKTLFDRSQVKYSKDLIKKVIDLLNKIQKHKDIVKLKVEGNNLVIDKPWYAGGKVKVKLKVPPDKFKIMLADVKDKVDHGGKFTIEDAIKILDTIDYKKIIDT